MALFRATIMRHSGVINGVCLEQGMSVEVSAVSIQTAEGKQKIADAFKNKYGIDLKKTGLFTQYMDIKKIG